MKMVGRGAMALVEEVPRLEVDPGSLMRTAVDIGVVLFALPHDHDREGHGLVAVTPGEHKTNRAALGDVVDMANGEKLLIHWRLPGDISLVAEAISLPSGE